MSRALAEVVEANRACVSAYAEGALSSAMLWRALDALWAEAETAGFEDEYFDKILSE